MGNQNDPVQKNQNKVYELRTYSLYPGKRKEFLDLVDSQYHVRTEGSNLLAYWVTEIGGINEVVHMWSYDDLDQRAEERTRLNQREEWKHLLSNLSPMMQKQDNLMLELHPDSPVPKASKEAGVFELQMYQMDSNSLWSSYLRSLIQKSKKMASNSLSTLVGVWQSMIGPQNSYVMIWQHATPNGVMQLKKQLDAENAYINFSRHSTTYTTKMMIPFVKHLWSETVEEK